MSNVLFEEDGGFKAAAVLSDAGTSLQIEYATGRRAKIKSNHVVLRFDTPSPVDMMQAAQAGAEQIDVDFLWECAPQDEFGFMDLADDYYGHKPSADEATALLLKLQSAPVYFHRKGRGRFRPAPAEVLKAALAAVERKRALEQRIENDAQALVDGHLPEAIGRQGAFLLIKPDKQGAEYRALDRACERLHLPPERVLLKAGAFKSAHDLHRSRFAAEYFAHGTGFTAGVAAMLESLPDAGALPLADDVQPFSIDDSTTTEIDDCLSVTPRAEGGYRVGIHIAAPGFAIAPGSALDELARDRMSTVYMPGDKITMLPDAAVARFSLDEGRDVPVLSLYADIDAEVTTVTATTSRVERIRVAANLRHDQLDETVTEAALDDPAAAMPFGDALRVLWRLTHVLSRERERVRGKPEPRFRTDFSFYIDAADKAEAEGEGEGEGKGEGGAGAAGGRETVRIVQRRRDAPLDRIVAEMMIFANSSWGRLLAEHKTPGIYRSQQAGRVRTSTHALPHQGLGVAQYMWSTSPLRRYVDLINQRQLIAALTGQEAPHPSGDADLFAIMTSFDARYAGYAEFQTRMERYWCLRWLDQRGLGRITAVVVRDDLVRLSQVPLYIRMNDVPALPAGRPIVIDVTEFDEVDLSVSARFIGEGSAEAGDASAEDSAALAEEGARLAGGEAEGAQPALGGEGVEGVDGTRIAAPGTEALGAEAPDDATAQAEAAAAVAAVRAADAADLGATGTGDATPTASQSSPAAEN